MAVASLATKILDGLWKVRGAFAERILEAGCKDKGLARNILSTAYKVLAAPIKTAFVPFNSSNDAYKLAKIGTGMYINLNSFGNGLGDYSQAIKIKGRNGNPQGSAVYSTTNGTIKLAFTSLPLTWAFLKPGSLVAKTLMAVPSLILIPKATTMAADSYEEYVHTGKTMFAAFMQNGADSKLQDKSGARIGKGLYHRIRDKDYRWWGLGVLKEPGHSPAWSVPGR